MTIAVNQWGGGLKAALAGLNRDSYCRAMRDEQMKKAVGDLMRQVSHTAQKEIEKHLKNAFAAGRLKDTQEVPVAVTLRSKPLDLEITIHSRVEL